MKIEKLTKEQEQHLEVVKNEWINRAFSGAEIDKEEATKGIKWLYKFSNLKEPIIIFVDSPFGVQLGVHFAKEILKIGGNQVDNQVWNQVRNQVGSQVWNQMGSQVWNQVGSQVENQVRNQVGSQVGSQVDNQVRNQVRSQVGSQVWNQVGNQVDNQVWNQVDNQVRSQVGNKVENQVRNQVRNQVDNQVGSQVGSQVRNLKYEPFSSYGNIWDYGWLSFYTVFEDFLIDLGDAKKDFNSFRNLIKSNIFNMVQLDGLCVVSALPKYVKRNARGDMHSDTSPAIEFKDGYKQHYLNGVFFPEDLWTKVVSKEFSFADRMKIVDIDQRTQAINPKYCDIDAFLKEVKAELLDEVNKYDINADDVNYKLYKIPKGSIFQEDAYYCYFSCPSTGKKHLEGVEVSKTVAEAMSWAEDISEEDWKLRIPLVHEN
jgi:hypothetical protein